MHAKKIGLTPYSSLCHPFGVYSFVHRDYLQLKNKKKHNNLLPAAFFLLPLQHEKSRGTSIGAWSEAYGSEDTGVGEGGRTAGDVHVERYGEADAAHGQVEHIPCVEAVCRTSSAA